MSQPAAAQRFCAPSVRCLACMPRTWTWPSLRSRLVRMQRPHTSDRPRLKAASRHKQRAPRRTRRMPTYRLGRVPCLSITRRTSHPLNLWGNRITGKHGHSRLAPCARYCRTGRTLAVPTGGTGSPAQLHSATSHSLTSIHPQPPPAYLHHLLRRPLNRPLFQFIQDS